MNEMLSKDTGIFEMQILILVCENETYFLKEKYLYGALRFTKKCKYISIFKYHT